MHFHHCFAFVRYDDDNKRPHHTTPHLPPQNQHITPSCCYCYRIPAGTSVVVFPSCRARKSSCALDVRA